MEFVIIFFNIMSGELSNGFTQEQKDEIRQEVLRGLKQKEREDDMVNLCCSFCMAGISIICLWAFFSIQTL